MLCVAAANAAAEVLVALANCVGFSAPTKLRLRAQGENGTGSRKRRRAAAANGYADLSDGAFDELLGSSEDEDPSDGADASDSSASPPPARHVRKQGRQVLV